MNVSGIQKNNVAFNGGKIYVAPSLRDALPAIKIPNDYNLCIARERNPVPQYPGRIAITIFKDGKDFLKQALNSISVSSKNVSKIPEIIQEKFFPVF
ncbi:MAG: hypothetical protein A2039_01560 [Candidatus Melainabacteria bacterium GWA2_34_9]|nr:MAG: hypothetical protein A2039_01560 [Candidatus Melainabacteria bacterium GWA2_34_9]